MNYYQYQIHNEEAMTEILIALFSQQPFDTFEESETGFMAYLPEREASEDVDAYITDLQEKFVFTFEKNFIPAQNWNEVWESNFQPILVDDFCGIRASFHVPLPQVRHEIVIDPRMAFGTGHHETTWMMMKTMSELNFQDAKIFDYGCGTGILAILAAKLGATHLDAVDIEEQSYENTIENANLNKVKGINVFHGTLETVMDTGYDFILANINRHVILDTLPALYSRLKKQGQLLISGILHSDETLLLEHTQKLGLTVMGMKHKGDWICLQLKK